MSDSATEPVTETVYFKITIRSFNRGDHWVARGLQTGIATYNETRDEAETRNIEGHVAVIRTLKQKSRKLLEYYLNEKGVEYQIGGAPWPDSQEEESLWRGAIMTNELARAA